MKKVLTALNIGFFLIGLSITSCSEEFLEESFTEQSFSTDQENNIESPKPKEFEKNISYLLEGDFSGKLDMTFLSSEGFMPPNQIIGVEIPWETSYVAPANIQAIGGFANGLYGDAQHGESASLKMFLDGLLIETVLRTADQDGFITLPLESYHLEFDKSGTTISDEHVGKDIIYKLEGDFSGDVNLIYKVKDGSNENIIIRELPWQHTFKTTKDSYEVRLYGLGSNGMENEEIEFSLLVEGTIVKSTKVLADNEGRIGLFPEIVHKFD